jgi:pimeloyl-ACP methyl ester carboxylesterase
MGHFGFWKEDGFRLHYWEGGKGKTLLFLHGGALPASTFRENKTLLAERFHVIVPDLPGFGKSDFPGPGWDYSDYARRLASFLDARGTAVDFLVGYSLGGGIAIELAPRIPALKRLILLSPGAESFSFRPGRLMLLVAAEAFWGLVHALLARRAGIFARIARDFLYAFIRWPFYQYRILRVVMRSLLMRHNPSAITVPTDIVSARDDRFFPPETGRRLAGRIPGATWRVQNGLHLWPLLDHERLGACLPPAREAGPQPEDDPGRVRP